MNGSYEIVINNTKKIETLLAEKLNAEGRGLHSKAGSVESALDKDILRKIRRVASIRNELMHEEGSKLDDSRQFESDCKDIIDYLSTTTFNNTNKHSSAVNSPNNTRLCKSCGAESRPKIAIKHGSLLFREKKRHICSLCGSDMYTTGGGASYVTTFGISIFLPSFFMPLFLQGNSNLPTIPNMFYFIIAGLIILTGLLYKLKPSGSPWFQTLTIWIVLLCVASWEVIENDGLIYAIPLTLLSSSMIFWIWKYRNSYIQN